VAQALAFAEDREAAFDSAASVLVHGDAHDANAVQAIEGTRGCDSTSLTPMGCWPSRPTTSASS
jgi:hypothetical protein